MDLQKNKTKLYLALYVTEFITLVRDFKVKVVVFNLSLVSCAFKMTASVCLEVVVGERLGTEETPEGDGIKSMA